MKAFPGNRFEGMELRDYFAARAMQVRMPQIREMFIDGTLEDWDNEAIPSLAKDAYALADAMMKARGIKNETT
jgi:hypothetical protein